VLRSATFPGAIYQGFLEPNATVEWMTHTVPKPIIKADGDVARCQWYLWLPDILTDGGKSLQDDVHNDRCRRVDGQWLFEYMQGRLHRLPRGNVGKLPTLRCAARGNTRSCPDLFRESPFA
jgi:hypothetical protein